MLTPERIREVLVACEGSQTVASTELGIDVEKLRRWMRHYKAKGYKFPKTTGKRFVQAKTAEILQPGEWVEVGQAQDSAEIVEVNGGRALVKFTDNRCEWRPLAGLTWVPSGDVTAEATQRIRDNWREGEHARRAPHAYPGPYEVPHVVLEDDSRDDTW